VRVHQLHNWNTNSAQAIQIQRELARQISQKNEGISPQFIAGVDISVADTTARAAVVVLSYPSLEIAEVKTDEDRLTFPYIPGLLSFREAPLVSAACKKLSTNPDLIMIDGHGIAHPRRLGLASHLGLFLDTPTIGCAKSRLCGKHEPPDNNASAYAELVDNNEVIGVALRTKVGANPIYVSIGHKIDLPTAIYWVLECCRGYRLPEPTRLAHLAAGNKPIISRQQATSKNYSYNK